MGGHPERVRVAGEERRDQKDDGSGSRRCPEAGGLCGAGGYREAEGMDQGTVANSSSCRVKALSPLDDLWLKMLNSSSKRARAGPCVHPSNHLALGELKVF